MRVLAVLSRCSSLACISTCGMMSSIGELFLHSYFRSCNFYLDLGSPFTRHTLVTVNLAKRTTSNPLRAELRARKRYNNRWELFYRHHS